MRIRRISGESIVFHRVIINEDAFEILIVSSFFFENNNHQNECLCLFRSIVYLFYYVIMRHKKIMPLRPCHLHASAQNGPSERERERILK